jgi:ADP-heptose:LPS heptosyltransferase
MTPPERILAIRLGALGDLVLCFQAFHEIRTAHPGAEIALLTMPAFVEFARTMPWFNHIIADERPSFFQFGKWRNLVRHIRTFDPARVYDLQGKLRQTVLYFLSGPTHVEWSGAAPFCSHPRLWPPAPGMHFTGFIAAQLRLANVPAAGPPDLFWLDAPLGELSLPPRYAVLIPGCAPGRGYKRWPAAHYAGIAKRLHAQGIACVALGTAIDSATIASIRGLTPEISDLSGKTSLHQLAGIVRRAACVIGNDTGPTHLAAAVGAPTLALMSEHIDPLWSAPRGSRSAWLQGNPLSNLSIDEVSLALGKLMGKTT